MARTLIIDGITLSELRIVPNAVGQLVVYAVFALTTGGQIVTTLNRTVTTILSSSDQSALSAAFNAVEAAIARDQTT